MTARTKATAGLRPAMAVSLTVQGVPVAKGRPRMGNGHAYTPQKTRDAEEALGWAMKAAMMGREPLEGPLSLRVGFFFEAPRSWAKTKRGAFHAHTVRPDLDNLVKTVKDAGNGILWKDDSQVCELVAAKWYGMGAPSTEIELSTERLRGGNLTEQGA